MSDLKYEFCRLCDEKTGRAGKGEDSLYFDERGPYCEDCYNEIRACIVPSPAVRAVVEAWPHALCNVKEWMAFKRLMEALVKETRNVQ